MTGSLHAETAVELRDASVVTAGRQRLHPTSLRLSRGTITAVIGRNGSGKSTLLAVMAAEIEPDSGAVLIGGDDVHRISLTERARRRSLLTQETHVAFGFTVEEVVRWGRTPWRQTEMSRHDDDVVAQAIDSQDLADLADRPVTELSGGERKRVHIARVLAQQADVLLLDEADADLDLVGRKVIDDVVVEQARAGRTVVVVSHDVTRLARVCDQVILMRHGHIHAFGSGAETLTEPLLSEAFEVPVAVTRHPDSHLDVVIRIA